MKYLPLLVAALALGACQHAGSGTGKNDDTGKKADTWVTYSGTLPCADCGGILTELTIHEMPGSNEAEFKLKETYQGTKSGRDEVFRSDGIYRIVQGSGPQPCILLNPDKDKNLQRSFQQTGLHELKMLDNSQQPIESALNYTLKSNP
ncbi:MAG TPA: copper resistance protein NlpE N-terminal domain-containing protein [Chitinophaga sp.]|uniref:copper resistance protein NlpE N-terminal domain-containing protein n=1 Tax=Chitinophaga sp. TaxID=1869181 RepID=UPI002C9D6D11|nr:copper resistance protein NlpE N-terminal domain-containing protein [Chitinophaga sp.]HVI46287.1 copper resistance protein NlpE N-terminal domain-containing protein [Chitinophaga sp.]